MGNVDDDWNAMSWIDSIVEAIENFAIAAIMSTNSTLVRNIDEPARWIVRRAPYTCLCPNCNHAFDMDPGQEMYVPAGLRLLIEPIEHVARRAVPRAIAVWGEPC